MGCIPLNDPNNIYRYDDTDAFGQNFMTINATIPEGWVISKAIWKAGSVEKVFQNPVFPITVNLNSEESGKLKNINTCYLAVYDQNNKKQTCNGSLKFITKAEVV